MKLLIVEDDYKTSQLLIKHFTSLGYQIESATSHQQAWQVLNSLSLNAILLDRYLNNTDSINLVIKIRRSIDTPIIMLTLSSDKSALAAALDSGVDDYLTKPFDLAELEWRLYALLRRNEQMRFPGTLIPLGQGSYDLKNHEFITPQGKITLTKTECQILLCLLFNKQSLVSKDKLASKFSPDGHALNTHILNLRKKLGEHVTITTIPGQGFIIGE